MRVFPEGIRKRSPVVLFLVLLVLSVSLSLFLTRKGLIREAAPKGQERRERADLTIQKFHYTEREKGEQKWEIWADKAERFLGTSMVHMDQVRMRYLLNDGAWIHLAGRSGDYFEKEKRVELQGDVQVQSDSGYSLYTEQLEWEQGKNLLRSEKPVRLVTERYTVTGDSMAFRTDVRKLDVVGSVRTVISTDAPHQGGPR